MSGVSYYVPRLGRDSDCRNYVKTRMSLSIVRSISMLLRGCRSSTWKRRAPDYGVSARPSVTSLRW